MPSTPLLRSTRHPILLRIEFVIIDPAPRARTREGRVGEQPEYAIAGTHREFLDWVARKPERRRITFLTKERAQDLVDRKVRKGKLHRIGMWERSEARELAEQLEA